MELHTVGVDGGYTQKDVQEVARCFTGWTIVQPRGEGVFHFEPRIHDNGEKIVLGQRIPRGGGMDDGLRVIDILAQPSVDGAVYRRRNWPADSSPTIRRRRSSTKPPKRFARATAISRRCCAPSSTRRNFLPASSIRRR